MWIEVKVIADVVLTVGGLTLGVILTQKMCKAVNYFGRIANALETYLPPDCLRKAIQGGPAYLAEMMGKYVTPEQRCPGLRKAAIEHGPEEDYPEGSDPQADYDSSADRKEEVWKKAQGAKAKLEKTAKTLLTGGEF